MKNKESKNLCVYAGPEIMNGQKPEPVLTEACKACGAKIAKGTLYCSECGMPQFAPQPYDPSLSPQQCMATYAGPPIPQGQIGVMGISAPLPYPQNFQTDREEPIDVYAGPPIDDEPNDE